MKRTAARQKAATLQFVLTASHDAVLQAVYKYQMLTTLQLIKALGYSPNSLALVQRLTKQLADNEYLLSLARPVLHGKAPLVFSLARKGLNYLKSAGFDVREYFRPSREREKSYLFLQHTLAVGDFLISASRLSKSAANYSLHSFIHERVLKQTPYKISNTRAGRLEHVSFVPDAFLDFREQKKNGKTDKIPILLELDRGTTGQKHFRRNLRARIEFLKEEGYRKLLGTTTVTFAYAVALGGQKRRDELRAWARKELADTGEKRLFSNLFLFCGLPDGLTPKQLFLEPCWLSPFEDGEPVSLLAE